jgi:hypothetical protein
MRDLLKVFQRVISSKAGALPQRIQQGVAPSHEEADDWHSPKKQIPHSELPQEMLEMLNHMEKTGQVAKRVPKVAKRDKEEDADDGDGAGDEADDDDEEADGAEEEADSDDEDADLGEDDDGEPAHVEMASRI